MLKLIQRFFEFMADDDPTSPQVSGGPPKPGAAKVAAPKKKKQKVRGRPIAPTVTATAAAVSHAPSGLKALTLHDTPVNAKPDQIEMDEIEEMDEFKSFTDSFSPFINGKTNMFYED